MANKEHFTRIANTYCINKTVSRKVATYVYAAGIGSWHCKGMQISENHSSFSTRVEGIPTEYFTDLILID